MHPLEQKKHKANSLPIHNCDMFIHVSMNARTLIYILSLIMYACVYNIIIIYYVYMCVHKSL